MGFVLLYSLWLLHLRQRAKILLREGHFRRYLVTVSSFVGFCLVYGFMAILDAR